uniref:ATP synthase F0 subunit 8 n=1 Tax=Menida lata TaxID=3028194 RepID=UPI0023D7D51A|nr:ATP synthase F0 subunit 8 [Menida lata]WDD39694.1 ATP synthase F0 subunit 8 [Menida lata]
MPQMAPLWWEILFILFLFLFMIMNIMVYFTKKNSFKIMSNNKKNMIQFNWTW